MKGCLRWVLYGFIILVVLGACSAMFGGTEEEEKVSEEPKKEVVEKPKEEKKAEPKKEEKKSEPKDEKPKTVEDVAKNTLGKTSEVDFYENEYTVSYYALTSSNTERMRTIITDEITDFLFALKDSGIDDYETVVVMANADNGSVPYSLRATKEQVQDLPENNIDNKIQVQYNLEDYVEQVQTSLR